MLGITLPDAIVVGTFLLAVLAAWKGSSQGEAAKSKAAPALMAANVGMAMGDTAAMGALTQAIIGLTEAVNHASQQAHDEAARENGDLLKQILEQLKRSASGVGPKRGA